MDHGQKPTATSFQNLDVYRLAETLGDHLWEIVQRWPHFAQDTLGKQMVRSADSIAANVAEGAGRWSKADQRRFLYIARGSLYETQHWLRRARRRDLLLPEEVAKLAPLVGELLPRLNAFIRALGPGTPSVAEPLPAYVASSDPDLF